MNSLDVTRMGLKNLFRRKLRTFLTSLGIAIGTISIVVMVSLAIGMSAADDAYIKQMGSVNIMDVYPSYNNVSGKGKDQGPPQLTEDIINKIGAIAGVEAVAPSMQMQVKLVSGKYEADVTLMGIKPEHMKMLEYKIGEGKLLNNGDKLNLVFGSQVPYQFRNPKVMERNDMNSGMNKEGGMNQDKPKSKVNVLKDKIKIVLQNEGQQVDDKGMPTSGGKKLNFKIKTSGVLQEGQYDKDYSAFINIEEFKKLKGIYEKEILKSKGTKKKPGYESAKVKVKDIKKIKEIKAEIEKLGCNASGMMDVVEGTNKRTKTMELIFGGIGAVSLLVAAIGITNTMVMAIYERRKEIGVMKVIGASIRDIKKIFLFEATLIGTTGGLVGIVVSFGVSKIINILGNKYMGEMAMQGSPELKLSLIPLWLAASALLFTSLIGLISGYLPARKAMKLSALEAIKTD